MENKNNETLQDRILKLIYYLRRINNTKSFKLGDKKENNKD